MNTRNLLVSGATALGLTAAGVAIAETSHDSASSISGTSETVTHPLSETHVVMMSNSTHDAIVSADASNPMNGAKGVCFGMMEMVEGKMSGGGYCNYDDVAGERYVVKWAPTAIDESGAVTGDWSLIGGAGKWVGSSGGGTFVSLTDPNTGKFENTITGEIKLK